MKVSDNHLGTITGNSKLLTFRLRSCGSFERFCFFSCVVDGKVKFWIKYIKKIFAIEIFFKFFFQKPSYLPGLTLKVTPGYTLYFWKKNLNKNFQLQILILIYFYI